MGISIWQLLIVLGIVILLFGTKKLRNLGSDIGSAVKSFKSAVKEDSDDSMKKQIDQEETSGSETGTESESKSDTRDKV